MDTQGDALFVAFARASDAVAPAGKAQDALADGPVRARIGVHTGEPVVMAEGYIGVDVHRAARNMGAGHGGQVLLSETTRQLLDSPVEVRDLGDHRLKDLGAQRPYQLGDGEFSPLRAGALPPARGIQRKLLPGGGGGGLRRRARRARARRPPLGRDRGRGCRCAARRLAAPPPDVCSANSSSRRSGVRARSHRGPRADARRRRLARPDADR